jgi:hypothetical protein
MSKLNNIGIIHNDFYKEQSINNVINEIEIYIIHPFPKLEVIQLPNIYINHSALADEFSENGIMYFYDLKICKTDLEELVTLRQFKNVMLLKMEHDFLFADMTMSKFLEVANKTRRKSNLKLFW